MNIQGLRLAPIAARALAVLAALSTLSACTDLGSIKAEIRDLQIHVRELSSEINAASDANKSAADKASTAAQAAAAAQRTADEALASARAALSCCDSTNEKTDRMFKRSAPHNATSPVAIATVERSAKCAHCAILPIYRVWFGTNRKPVQDSTDFTDKRDTALHVGYCDVYVPPTHVPGELGSSWIVRLMKFRDDRLRVDRVQSLSQDAFQELLSEELKGTRPGDRSALVYIHGFRNSFMDAATRAAQIGYDLKVDGITAFFSWPSKDVSLALSAKQYVADGSAVDASEEYLREFLEVLSMNPAIERLDILAHSMGNRALLRNVAKLRTDMAIKPIRDIILAAPDVDSDVFNRLAVEYPKLAKGSTTLYVASKDLALGASGIVNNYPRAGYTPPVAILDGIDTIDASNVDFDLIGLGHDYYAQSDALLRDMFKILHHGDPPNKRQGPRPTTDPTGRQYWVIR